MTEHTREHVEKLIAKVLPGATAEWNKVTGTFRIRGIVKTSILPEEAEGFIEGIVTWKHMEEGELPGCNWHRFSGAKASGFREGIRVMNEITEK